MATFPERALGWVNLAMVWLGDVLLAPLLGLPPLAGLAVVSLVTAAAVIPVIALTSDQRRMAAARRHIHAALLEIRLYNEDPRAVFRALGDALWHNAVYLRLTLVPLAWMVAPLALVVIQLQMFYGYRGFEPDAPVLVKVELDDGGQPVVRGSSARLEAPAAIRVETDPVWLPASNEVLWRVVPAAPGEHVLTVHVGGHSASKTLHVSDRPARRSPRRVARGLVDQLLYPSEPPIENAGPMAAIAMTYPDAAVDVLGWHTHWLVVYIGLTMLFGFALARRFGVTV